MSILRSRLRRGAPGLLCLVLAALAGCRRPERVAYLRPEGLSVRPGERPGEVVLTFGPVEGATRYRVEVAPSPDGPFTRAGEVHGSPAVVKLSPGESYVFRVAGDGPNGRSTWSLLAGCSAPRMEDLWDRLHPPPVKVAATPAPLPRAGKKRR